MTIPRESGWWLIREERFRQILEEKFTLEHDRQYKNDELIAAAMCYLGYRNSEESIGIPYEWPWDGSWWKPKGAIRNLVKAGALIAAAIDALPPEEKDPEIWREPTLKEIKSSQPLLGRVPSLGANNRVRLVGFKLLGDGYPWEVVNEDRTIFRCATFEVLVDKNNELLTVTV